MLNNSAPIVTLNSTAIVEGNIVNVTEGSEAIFKCKYDDVTPPGKRSVFNFNGTQTILSKVSTIKYA